MFPTEIAKIIVSYLIHVDVDGDVSQISGWINCMSCYSGYEYCKWKEPSGDIIWMDFCDRDTIRCSADAMMTRRDALIQILTSPWMIYDPISLAKIFNSRQDYPGRI